jgi:DNA-binding MarR family transcriptional regulator
VIHERFRLAILCALAVHASMPFIDLTRFLGMTYGNLHIHAKRLEEVGYLQSDKQGEGRQTRTRFSITRAGRKALDRYFAQMESVIAATRRL